MDQYLQWGWHVPIAFTKLKFSVVGARFQGRPAIDALRRTAQHCGLVFFKEEKTNRHDANAQKAYVYDYDDECLIDVGYMTKTDAALCAKSSYDQNGQFLVCEFLNSQDLVIYDTDQWIMRGEVKPFAYMSGQQITKWINHINS